MFEVDLFTMFPIRIEYISFEDNLLRGKNSSSGDNMILAYVVLFNVTVIKNYFFPSWRNCEFQLSPLKKHMSCHFISALQIDP